MAKTLAGFTRRGLVATVLGVNGAGMLAAGLVLLAVNAHFIANAVETSGVVVAFREYPGTPSKSGARNSSFAPVVAFDTRDGRRVEFVALWSSNPPAYAAGDRVAVLHHPEQPDRAMIDSFTGKWLLPAIFAGIGQFLLILAVLIMRWPGRTRPAAT